MQKPKIKNCKINKSKILDMISQLKDLFRLNIKF